MFCNRTVRVAIYGRRNIIHNAFALMFIVIVLKRKSSYCVIAEKWLKQDYIMNGKEKEGEKRGLKWKRGKVNGKVRES